MKIVRSSGRFRILPTCCAQKFDGKKFKKVNWLFACWMFCLGAPDQI